MGMYSKQNRTIEMMRAALLEGDLWDARDQMVELNEMRLTPSQQDEVSGLVAKLLADAEAYHAAQ